MGEMLQFLNHICGPLLSRSGMSVALFQWEPRTGQRIPGVASPSLIKREGPPIPASNPLPNSDEDNIPPCSKHTMLAHVRLMFARNPRVFSAKQVSSCSPSSINW